MNRIQLLATLGIFFLSTSQCLLMPPPKVGELASIAVFIERLIRAFWAFKVKLQFSTQIPSSDFQSLVI